MDRIGPYQVEAELGRGGMGVVYRVREEGQDRVLALKLILPHVASAEAMARFGREAEVLGRVRHPNVVRVHTLGRAPEGPYIVSELIEGEDLKTRLRTGPLEANTVAKLIRDLADAVAACHGVGVLHRDLKPANVMLRSSDGSPVLLDFGVAQDESAERLTRTGALLGTLNYMSPEQASGERQQVGKPTDVYGLGAILYTCISGEPPYADKSSMALVKAVLTDLPSAPSAIREGIPPGLEAICRKAMAKELHQRYETAEELREELDRFLAGKPPLALGQEQRRSSKRVIVGVLAALALVGLLIGLAWAGSGEETPPEGVAPVVTRRRAPRGKNIRLEGREAYLELRENLRGEELQERARAWWGTYRAVEGLDPERAELRLEYLQAGLKNPRPMAYALPATTRNSLAPGGVEIWPSYVRFLPGSNGSTAFVFGTYPKKEGLTVFDVSSGKRLREVPLRPHQIGRLATGTDHVVLSTGLNLTWLDAELNHVASLDIPNRPAFEPFQVVPKDETNKPPYTDLVDVSALAISPEGLVAAGFDRKLLLVFERQGEELVLRGEAAFGQPVVCLAYLPDGRLVAGIGNMDRTIERGEDPDIRVVFLSRELTEERSFRLAFEPALIQPSPTGDRVVVGTASSRQLLVFRSDGELITRLVGEGGDSVDNAKQARPEQDGEKIVPALAGTPTAVAWSPDGTRIYAVAGDLSTANKGYTEFRVWRSSDFNEIACLKDREVRPDPAAERRIFWSGVLSPNGAQLVTTTLRKGSGKAQCEVWDVDLPN